MTGGKDEKQGDKTSTTTPPAAAGTTAAGSGATGGTRQKEVRQPPPPHTPQILQLTPELFQQTVAAAVTAALTAAQVPQVPAVNTSPPTDQVIPRKEKKLAEFWVSRPIMWFRLFDGQFPATMTEDARFNALLNHLPSTALPFVDHILRNPGLTPFTASKECLIEHYEVSPRDKARALRSLTSLGDRTPSEMLHYMRSLLPGVPDNALFEAIFIDLLPANARDAAVKHDDLSDMAKAADRVLAEAPATSTMNAISGGHDHILAQVGATSSSKRSGKPPLCFVHRNYGKKAFSCASPGTCSMRNVIAKPDPSSLVQGNSNAGRHTRPA